jgi:exonuclease III
MAGLSVHNVYLSAYSWKDRRDVLLKIAGELRKRNEPLIVAGDFNLAPSSDDGCFGEAPSKFTRQEEREALVDLLKSALLYDSTRCQNGTRAQFTFERLRKGIASRFRCDLALISDSIRSSIAVAYDHSVRKGPCAFTDHSALIIDFMPGDAPTVSNFSGGVHPD